MDADRVINDFLQLYGADHQRGATRTAANYMALFPGYEELIAAELTNLEAAPPTAEVSGAPPSTIGPYRILRGIGEGGMGAVYLAEQLEPVRRQVAIKVIRPGTATSEILRRFDVERQALAVMSHPYIAKVFDAGLTRDVRPYFVMEYVEGVRIDAYCDRHRLGIRQRLQLFCRVCAAVQHAHQRGVMHRDLKPSNILVAQHEGDAVPKIIDFGLARASDAAHDRSGLLTEHGQVLGTPDYMSPEQADPACDDIDTRTDVYSLGTVLYQLLVGALPFASASDSTVDAAEVRRAIREDDPPRPSRRVRSMSVDVAETVSRIGTTTTSLARALRVDLDWIVLRALDKDRRRRYQTPLEFADDIGRYLAHQPVEACPPTTTYRLRKFTRRYRVQLAVCSIVFLALVVAGAGTALGLVEARHQRDVAQDALRRANQHAATSSSVLQFLVGMFSRASPNSALGARITVKEVLDQQAPRMATAFVDQPLVRATLMASMGEVYLSLGSFEEARPLIETAGALRRTHSGEDHVETARTSYLLAQLHRGLGNYEDSRRLLDQVLAIWRPAYGERHPRTVEAILELVAVFEESGQPDRADPLSAQALAAARASGDATLLLMALNSSGKQCAAAGRSAQAERLLLEAVAVADAHVGSDHPQAINAKAMIASFYFDAGQHAESEPLLREVLERVERVLGDRHRIAIAAMSNLGMLYLETNRHAESEPLLEEACRRLLEVLGPRHPNTLFIRHNIARLYWLTGRHAASEELYRSVVADQRAVIGDRHPQTLTTMHKFAGLLLEQKRYSECEPLYLEALRGRRATQGDEHPYTLSTINNLAVLYLYTDRVDEAEPLAREALRGRRKLLGDKAPDTLDTMYLLSAVLSAQERWSESIEFSEQVLASQREVLGDAHMTTIVTIGNLAAACLQVDDVARAEELLKELVQAGHGKSTFVADMLRQVRRVRRDQR